MRRKAQVVIGAGYGDEGKGLVVDALAAQFGGEATVIRFNGGAQAGHTVVTPDGRRHVFHHVSAGALAGAATFLSRFFIVNPMLFHVEADALAALGANLDIAVDRQAPVTLPSDMMINQIVERARSAGRHGSCGLGIGETVERNLRPEFAVRAGDLVDAKKLKEKLSSVRARWVAPRLAALGVRALAEPDRELLADETIDKAWLEDASRFCARVKFAREPGRGPLFFEGAQGLRLDALRGDFPFVTRSRTGCCNTIALAREWGVDTLDLIYVSRVYLTRHGAGPLSHEQPGAPFPGFVDATNAPNPWQGAMRCAPLDLDALAATIAADIEDASGFPHTTSLAMTCLDQPPGPVEYIEQGAARFATPEALALRAVARTGARRLLMSRGPTRATFGPSAPASRARAKSEAGVSGHGPQAFVSAVTDRKLMSAQGGASRCGGEI